MLKVKEAKEQADALLAAHKILTKIIGLAKDHKQEWGSRSEISMFRLILGRCLKPEVIIEIWLTSHVGAFRGFSGLDGKEKRENEADNKRARAFVLAVLQAFKLKAKRATDTPEHLNVTVTDEISLRFYGFPTSVTYECEKQCVAVLPGGKKIPISDVPVEL